MVQDVTLPSKSSTDNIGLAEIGLDTEDFKRTSCTVDFDEESSLGEEMDGISRQISFLTQNIDEQCKDTVIVEIVDRGNKALGKPEEATKLSAKRVSSETQDKINAPPIAEEQSTPKEMSLFRAELCLLRNTLLRSPYFARLLCGQCKHARKLQLNLRDPHTNIEAMIAASFFLDSGVIC